MAGTGSLERSDCAGRGGAQFLMVLPIEEWMPLWTLAAVGVATALMLATAAALLLALLDRSAAEARRRRFRKPRAAKEAGALGSVADVRPVPLSSASRDDYIKRWRYLLSRFVDEPRASTAETHDLARKLLSERGFSLEDLDRDNVRFPDEHLVVAENYRMAHRATSGLRSARTEQCRRETSGSLIATALLCSRPMMVSPSTRGMVVPFNGPLIAISRGSMRVLIVADFLYQCSYWQILPRS